MVETWLDAIADRRPGPAAKQGYPAARQRTLAEIAGFVAHSMEGSLTAALGELDNAVRTASWTFSNPKAGRLLQHYPLESVTWASGSLQANIYCVSCESEGVAGELLNANQRQNVATLLGELGKLLGLKWQRQSPGKTLWEHNEMTAFGAAPTACPSNRYPWPQILALIPTEDDMVDPALEAKLKKWFLEPHGIAAYNKRFAGRETWTPADVVLYASAYLDAQHIEKLMVEHKALAQTLDLIVNDLGIVNTTVNAIKNQGVACDEGGIARAVRDMFEEEPLK